MTETEKSLLERFRAPAVPLVDICEAYFGIGPTHAQQQAKMNLLPVPTFRMSESRKAPRLVKLSDLAAFIDTRAAEARKDWQASQV